MMIPTCFSQPNTVSGGNNGGASTDQNIVTSIYQTHLANSPTYITLTWSKTLSTHSLTISASASDSLFTITISLYPSTFSLFKPKPGSKSINLTHTHYKKLKLYYDFTKAHFTESNSAEPESNFYLAITHDTKLEFFVGDLPNELTRLTRHQLTESTQLSRREHVFGHKTYVSRAQFLGSKHEIVIDCNNGALKVKVNGQIKLVVKKLAWKFRGKERIFIDGVKVEFFWDVFNWVNISNGNGNFNDHGVFIFQVGDGGVSPDMVGPEKRLMKKTLTSSTSSLSPTASCSSVMQWAEESSDCGGRSSSGFSSTSKSYGSGINNNGGFSLLLYAYMRD
ncbi:hypothetical protein ACFE04_028580 [Oxalis oulophora]